MRRKLTLSVLALGVVLVVFFLAPIIPANSSSIGCGPHTLCPLYSGGTFVSASYYLFGVGGTSFNSVYVVWYWPGWNCYPYAGPSVPSPGSFTCSPNAIKLWPVG